MRRTQESEQALKMGLYKLGFVTFVLLVVLLLGLTACGRKNTTEIVVTPAPTPIPVLTQPATLQQCAAGGTVVMVGDTSTIVCNGANGIDGANGQNGTNGQNGQNGVNGQDGKDGTQIGIIQFCPGTAKYPTVFPEIGFLINGKVYAVYSANDGFLTYLPPGLYQSNAIGNSCTFTVNANGTVSH